MAGSYYTIIERSIIEKAFREGKSDLEIALALVRNGYPPRTEAGIDQIRRKMGLLRIYQPPQYSPDKKKDGDRAFKRAMLAAARAGSENVVCGVVKDKRPLKGMTFYPEPVNSGCSSAANLCAEG